MRKLLLLTCMLLTNPVRAQDLLLMGGTTHEAGLGQTTHAWSIEYDNQLGKFAYFSLGWINEGHLKDHRRDGPLIQLGGRIKLLDSHLMLSLGLGPYAYFDTALAADGASYANDHGFGLVYSAGMSWYADSPWFLHLRANHIETDTHIDTTSLLLGVGYQLDRPNAAKSLTLSRQATRQSEWTVFVGSTILNSFRSENSLAVAIEYRRAIDQYVDWTIGWLHESGQHIIRRNGMTSELWAVRSCIHNTLELGAGAGVYVVINKEHLDSVSVDENETISGMITLSAAYRFNTNWLARLSWNRIVTGYSRDTDVLLVGSGYQF